MNLCRMQQLPRLQLQDWEAGGASFTTTNFDSTRKCPQLDTSNTNQMSPKVKLSSPNSNDWKCALSQLIYWIIYVPNDPVYRW